MQGVKATDNGDTVRFVKASAFGDIQWVKKKTELSDEERQLLSAQTAAKPAKQD